jgi:hypothetical protein
MNPLHGVESTAATLTPLTPRPNPLQGVESMAAVLRLIMAYVENPLHGVERSTVTITRLGITRAMEESITWS